MAAGLQIIDTRTMPHDVLIGGGSSRDPYLVGARAPRPEFAKTESPTAATPTAPATSTASPHRWRQRLPLPQSAIARA